MRDSSPNCADGKAQTILEVKQFSLTTPPASTFAIPEGCQGVQTEASSKPSTNVTAVKLQSIPNYKGPCPAHIRMVGTITADGPGTVFYQFGGGSMDPGQTLVFSAAGTKTVTHTMAFQPKYGNDMGVGAILAATGADASGGHGLAMQASSNADLKLRVRAAVESSSAGHYSLNLAPVMQISTLRAWISRRYNLPSAVLHASKRTDGHPNL